VRAGDDIDYTTQGQVAYNATETDLTMVNPIDDVYSFSAGPNPFSETTKIYLTSDVADDIKIHLFTMQGTMVQEIYTGPVGLGSHSYIISAEDLKAGIYICKLISEKCGTKSIRLVKSK
jgi:hypothetical protein